MLVSVRDEAAAGESAIQKGCATMSRAQQFKSGDISLGLAHEWVCAFGRQGGTARFLQELLEDPDRFRRLMYFWDSGMPFFPKEFEHDFFQVEHLLNLQYGGEKERILKAYPTPPKPVEGFLTFFDPGWSIADMNLFWSDRNDIIFPYGHAYNGEAFLLLEEKPCYRQMRYQPVGDSHDRRFFDHKMMVPDDEEIPHARQVVMGMIIHYLLTGSRIFPNLVRCIDVDQSNNRVCVGNFIPRKGLGIRTIHDGYHAAELGVVTAKK